MTYLHNFQFLGYNKYHYYHGCDKLCLTMSHQVWVQLDVNLRPKTTRVTEKAEFR